MAEELNDQEHRETELWQVLDWSLWGNGLGDRLREAIADKAVAALTPQERETAERCIKTWHKGRGPSVPVGVGTELERQRDLLLWLHAEAAWELGHAWDLVHENRSETEVYAQLAQKRLVAREDWKARCLSAEASRQAWAEQAAALKDAARESYDELGDYIQVLTNTDRPEIAGRRVAAVKAQRIIGGYFSAVMADWHDADDRRVCACVTDEQAAQIQSAGPRWVRPQCAVLPEAGGE